MRGRSPEPLDDGSTERAAPDAGCAPARRGWYYTRRQIFDKNKVNRDRQPISTPTIIPRAEHGISRADISENALKVLYRLHKAGYEAYLVGGGVRDLLLGLHPKDFDVATNASPEEVQELFRNCRLIGRRFRLAHVRFGREIIEVATFRAHHDQGEGEGKMENGLILRDNVFGTLEDDAWRRDFSINALYYNIADFSLVDYTGGMRDLQNRELRIIGDPVTRFREDPVRMLRALRFVAKLDFHLEPGMAEAIRREGERLLDVPAARLFEEVLKLFLHGQGLRTYTLMREYGLFRHLFPETDALLESHGAYLDPFIRQGLINTDARVREQKPVTPAYLFAVLLWGPVRKRVEMLQHEMRLTDALRAAGDEVNRETLKRVTLPRRFSLPMREIWQLQARLEMRRGKRAWQLLENRRFRAAYDFLLLREQAGEPIGELCRWWTEFQVEDEAGQQRMVDELPPGRKKKKKIRGKKRTIQPLLRKA